MTDMTDEYYNKTYFIEPSNPLDRNFAKSYNSLSNFYTNTFISFSSPNNNLQHSKLIIGQFGYYYGMGYDFYMSVSKINKNVLKTGLEITYLDKVLWNNGLRAITVSFTIYHPQSDFYFYVYLLYEFGTDGSVSPPVLSIDYFRTNIYQGDEGTRLGIMDAARLVFTVFIFFFLVQTVISDRKRIYEKNSKANLFHVITQAKIISEFLILVLYWASFSIKQVHLHDTKYIYWLEDSASHEYIQKPKYEFFWTLYNYLTDNGIEAIIFLILLWRFILVFFSLKRIRSLSFFYLHAFIKISTFFFILILFLFSLSVFANNLFGSDSSDFKNLSSSFTSLLMFSIGHYPQKISKNTSKGWLGIFSVLLLLVVVYFFLSTFVGIYLESFRIVSLRKGYSFDKKDKDSELLSKYIVKRPKKKSEKVDKNGK